MKITHDGITYQMESEEYQVIKSRYDFMCKFGVNPEQANHAATVLTLEQFFSEFDRSDADQEIINQVNRELNAALNQLAP